MSLEPSRRMLPPAWSRLVLGWIVPRDRRDDVLGDLEEVHGQRLQRSGAVRAWLSTSAETWLLGLAFLYYRMVESRVLLPRAGGHDVRFALRLMLKQPILTISAVLAMATGMAVAITAFTAADAALFGQLPFDGGERFVRLEAHTGSQTRPGPMDLELFRQLKASKSFVHIGATDRVEVNAIYRSGEVEPLLGAWITPDSFGFLPAVPLFGRGFEPSDGVHGGKPVAVIRESLWRRRFEASSAVIGEMIQVDGQDFRIVGVLPDRVGFPAGGELWMALDDLYLGGSAERPRRGLSYFGVLDEGASLAGARLEAALVLELLSRGLPEDRVPRLTMAPYLEPRPQEKASAVLTVATLGLLLVVIASSVANLIYARTVSRQAELAVRSALGAGRQRLVGQIVVEVTCLALLAALLAVLAAQAGLRWLEPRLLEKPYWLELTVGPRSVLFAVASTALTALVAGLWPALRATRRDPACSLGGTGTSRGDLSFSFGRIGFGRIGFGRIGCGRIGFGRIGGGLMALQLSLAVALLTFALVIGRSLDSGGWHESVRLPEDRVLTAQVLVPRPGAREAAAAVGESTARRVARAAAALPGVRSAGFASSLPGQAGFDVTVALEQSPGTRRRAQAVLADAGFLESLDAEPLSGRLLTRLDSEQDAARVALVTRPFADRYFADRYFGGRSALGQRLMIRTGGDEALSYEVVGIIADIGLAGGGPERGAGLILPQRRELRRFYLTLHTGQGPEALASSLRQAVAKVSPSLRVDRIVPLEQVTAQHRSLVGGFGGALVAIGFFVLALASLGLYALVSFTVTRRCREIGLRLALGASRLDILKQVIRGAGRPLVLGTGLGAVLTLGAGLLRLHEKIFALPLQPAEAWVLPAVLLALLVSALVAVLTPSRRALAIEPGEALKE